MNSGDLAASALRLTGESTRLLDQWMDQFVENFKEVREQGTTPDLKELAAFLACIKRTLEIARIAEALEGGEGGGDGG
ncbi:MAG: hypothetical protein JJU11_10360, partial [Candidatus Sumerlaeia bacterium]|nr:hypothetical protein [Candidatus Sumerlaeia bacterium]